jgi:lysophospholipase L1-like esterase
MKLISAIFPYNSLVFQIAMGNLEFNKKRMQDTKGYIPLIGIMKNEQIDTSASIIKTIDRNKVLALNDIISTCQQKKIQLVFVNSPTWGVIRDDYFEDRLLELCSENGIPFLDLSNHPAFISNPGYFADKSHLNNDGAMLFSKILTDTIRQIQ